MNNKEFVTKSATFHPCHKKCGHAHLEGKRIGLIESDSFYPIRVNLPELKKGDQLEIKVQITTN